MLISWALSVEGERTSESGGSFIALRAVSYIGTITLTDRPWLPRLDSVSFCNLHPHKVQMHLFDPDHVETGVDTQCLIASSTPTGR